jgi:alkylhydroperoxidase/carboxymuconolactone decarboxylase family protein YurZ
VKPVGVGELHAAFRNESRTRGHVQRRKQEIRGVTPRTALEVKYVLHGAAKPDADAVSYAQRREF